ncbi:hypothetical protein PG997_009981 [Apiospora hydei]|uniref:Uncharacterized protein n=1 Tax=Apiospora hydei TaxID=1337664 RepID=A0ABR1VZN9_9PEZI
MEKTSIIDEDDQAALAKEQDLRRSPAHPGYVMEKGRKAQYDPFVLIPEYFESSVCLRYLGLDDATAEKLWKEWDEDKDQERKDVESVQDDAVKHIKNTEPTKDMDSSDDRHWHELLSKIGVNDDFRKNLMDPHYKDIRLTNTCKYWVKYFFEHRKHTLVEIQRFSRERSYDRSAGKHTADQKLGRGPKTSVWSMAQAEKTGTVTLWSAQTFHRHSGLALNPVSWKVNSWRCVGKTGARDFTIFGAAYFTPQRDVALHSLGWHKKNDPAAGYLLIRVVVPKVSITNMEDGQDRIEMLSTDPRWQDVVSYSRRGISQVGADDDTSPVNAVQKALLIHGHMAKGLDRPERESPISSSGPVVPQVSSEAYLNRDGKPALQYAFGKDVVEIERMWDVKNRTTGQ